MTTLHALLIGINVYKAEALQRYPLKGCRNDVDRLAKVLSQLFPGQSAQTLLLKDEQATRAEIIRSFREHLIEPARRWAVAGRATPEPAFLFHFSGHGSLARDRTGTKPSGFDETTVPYDSRQGDVFDLRDWELGSLIDELGEFTTNITILLDCCHSGSGTRNESRTTRMCAADLRIPPAAVSSPVRVPKCAGLRSEEAPGMAAYVLLSACDAKQVAEEYHDTSSGKAMSYGAMTFALTEVLASLCAAMHVDQSLGNWHSSRSEVFASGFAPPISYRELHEHVRAKVRSWFPNQSPQCEGDRERLLFGTGRPQRDLTISVVEISDDGCTIDVGEIHGFAVGDEFDVYPPESRAVSEAGPAIARIRLEQSGVGSSRCARRSGHDPIPVRSRLFPLQSARIGIRRTVRIDARDSGRFKSLEHRFQQPDLSSRFHLVPTPDAEFTLSDHTTEWHLLDSCGLRLSCRSLLANVNELAAALTVFGNQRTTLQTRNGKASDLHGSVKCEMRQPKSSSAASDGSIPDYELVFPDADGILRINSGTATCFVVRNESTRPLYCQLLSFGYDGSVSRIWPKLTGEQVAVEPGRSLQTSRFRLMFDPTDKATPLAREFIKVFAATVPIDLDMHCTTSGQRSAAVLPLIADDWTTVELGYLLLRSRDPD